MSTPKQNQVATIKKDISTKVLAKIDSFQKSGELKLPKDYSAENALKSAYLILTETKNKNNDYALTYCTQESIANALLKMVVWGLTPLKKQCYFVMYGQTLDCIKDYTGNIALAKRYGGLKNIKAIAVFEGDEFEFQVDTETGTKKVTKHTQTLESMSSKKIKGAYAIAFMNDGTSDTEIMTISQIQDAWKQGATKGDSPAHRNFPDRMARKTVINRLCDTLIRSSDDAVLYDELDERKPIDVTHEDLKNEIEVKANKQEIDIDEAEVIEAEEVVDEKTETLEETLEGIKEGQQEISAPGF